MFCAADNASVADSSQPIGGIFGQEICARATVQRLSLRDADFLPRDLSQVLVSPSERICPGRASRNCAAGSQSYGDPQQQESVCRHPDEGIDESAGQCGVAWRLFV